MAPVGWAEYGRASRIVQDARHIELVNAALTVFARWRTPILLASALLAGVVGLVLLPGGEYVTSALYELMAYRPRQSPLPLVPLALVLLLVGGGVAAAAHE